MVHANPDQNTISVNRQTGILLSPHQLYDTVLSPGVNRQIINSYKLGIGICLRHDLTGLRNKRAMPYTAKSPVNMPKNAANQAASGDT